MKYRIEKRFVFIMFRFQNTKKHVTECEAIVHIRVSVFALRYDMALECFQFYLSLCFKKKMLIFDDL